ncbi:MAG: DUF4416 family protein [Calditrichia bacterium]|nr:DUF4416 family protein [Calditrichia bacterium]
MGEIKNQSKVKLIFGIMVKPEILIGKLEKMIEIEWGRIDLRSDRFNFSQHTSYYEKEMGAELTKYWISIEELIDRLTLPQIKIKTNKLEIKLSKSEQKRDVNFDPGYFTPANLILASTKDFSHRIYLGDGIFGDLHLIYEKKKFNLMPWTYADYRQKESLEFFMQVRDKYMQQLKIKD